MTAATHPERCVLVIVNGYARFARADDYPAGLPDHIQETYSTPSRQVGERHHALGPRAVGRHRPGVPEWWARVERFGATPRVARGQLETILSSTFAASSRIVEVPTLVIHSRDNDFVRVGHGRYLAEHIECSRLVERDSADHWPVPDADLVGADRGVRHRLATGSPTPTASWPRCSSSTSSGRPSGAARSATGRGASR